MTSPNLSFKRIAFIEFDRVQNTPYRECIEMNINNEKPLLTGWPGKNNVLIKCIFILLQILQKESTVHSVPIYLYPQIYSYFSKSIGIL